MGLTIEQAARLISHPLRAELLWYYANYRSPEISDGLSPSYLAGHLKEPIGNVSYHTRILAKAGAIKQVRYKQVRGAVEHFYSATDEGLRVLRLADAWEES